MLLREVRYGLRLMACRPALTAIAAQPLALDIGANATVANWIEWLV